MPPKKALPKVTIDELAAAMVSDDWLVRSSAVGRYSKQKPALEALPLLRQALTDPYDGIVKTAAWTIQKLGPAAIEAMDDLLIAADHIDRATNAPQSYPLCVAAMAAIDPTYPQLLPLIRRHAMSYSNWVPISASLRALRVIGTSEAKALQGEITRFWMPKFNKMQKRVAEKLLAENS
jgi:hypothetical protein